MLNYRRVTFVLALTLYCINKALSPHLHAIDQPGLAVREEEGRVVLAWNGPVGEPMREAFEAALAKYASKTRPFVVTLNSPGGNVEQGHRVMAAIRAAAQWHRVDMRVERGSICASMCVPIFLLGTERTADPQARFMFHEVRLVVPDKGEGGKVEGNRATAFADARSRKAVETLVTDVFYEADVGGARVNPSWLRLMRARIVGHDVWASARELVRERAGIVDALVPTGRS